MFILILLMIPFIVGAIVYTSFWITHRNGEPIRRSNWHYRFMTWIWGARTVEKLKSICPYAWGVFGSISFIVFILIVLAIKSILVKFEPWVEAVRESRERKCDEEKQKSREQALIDVKRLLNNTSDDWRKDRSWLLIRDIYLYVGGAYKKARWDDLTNKRKTIIYSLFDSITSEQRAFIKETINGYINKDLELKKERSSIKIEPVKLAKYGKIVAITCCLIVLYIVGFYLVSFVQFLYNAWWVNIDWMYTLQCWLDVIGLLIKLIVAAVIIYGTVNGIKTFMCKYCPSCEVRRMKFKRFMRILCYPFIQVWRGFVWIAKLLKDMFDSSCTIVQFED